MSVTIVVVPRERYSISKVCLDLLYESVANVSCEIVYVDVGSPKHIAQHLHRMSEEMHFKLIRRDDFVSPNVARNIGLRHANTDFVIFLDNDVVVLPGWIQALVAAANRTGAWAVSPVIFEQSAGKLRVHFAGAQAALFDGQYECKHFYLDCPPHELQLALQETDLFEFHCVLIRRSALNLTGPFDEHLFSALEQEDAALMIKKAGGKIYLEPAAQMTYVVGDIDRFDAEYIRWRWSTSANQLSVVHFQKKWGLPIGWGDDVVVWCNDHRQRLLKLLRSPFEKGLFKLAEFLGQTKKYNK